MLNMMDFKYPIDEGVIILSSPFYPDTIRVRQLPDSLSFAALRNACNKKINWGKMFVFRQEFTALINTIMILISF